MILANESPAMAIDREKQDDTAAQELASSRDKALRAREQFERQYEEGVRRERHAAGCCEMCGGPLTAFDRFRRAARHRRCTTFTE
jgi:hypothetical protein